MGCKQRLMISYMVKWLVNDSWFIRVGWLIIIHNVDG